MTEDEWEEFDNSLSERLRDDYRTFLKGYFCSNNNLERTATQETLKLYKARYLVEMTITRQPNLLEGGFAPFSDAEAVHCNKHSEILFL
jgi:hypothetical protein